MAIFKNVFPDHFRLRQSKEYKFHHRKKFITVFDIGFRKFFKSSHLTYIFFVKFIIYTVAEFSQNAAVTSDYSEDEDEIYYLQDDEGEEEEEKEEEDHEHASDRYEYIFNIITLNSIFENFKL